MASEKQSVRQTTQHRVRSPEPHSTLCGRHSSEIGQPYVHPPPDSSRFRADCPLFFTMLVKETSLGIADVAALHRVALCHHRGAVVRRVILREDLLPLQLAARPTSMGWRASPTLRATEQAADAAYAHSTHWALKRCVGPEPGTSLELVCAGVVRLPTSRACLMARGGAESAASSAVRSLLRPPPLFPTCPPPGR